MNLALKDIQHNRGRFALTALGIGMLLMIVMGMGGIYRGLIEEALLLVNRIGADLWVVQRNTRGPFAEVSRIPSNLEDRVKAVPGVLTARRFVSHTIQREHEGKPLRIVVQGLAWPDDKGEWLSLQAGRLINSAHFEMIADQLLGLRLGEKLTLGKDVYTIVGITKGMVGQGGDGVAFFTISDALAIQLDTAAEQNRLERQARGGRISGTDLGRFSPELLERAKGPAAGIPTLPAASVSAVLVEVRPGVDPEAVARIIRGWKDVSAHTAEEQRELLLQGVVDKSRRQIGLFRVLLVAISAIIMALILYTLTLDKVHDIAMLKLMGARNTVILGLILQQAILLGILGYIIAYLLGQKLFPKFPRQVIITNEDLILLGGIVLAISILSSFLGIWKAMRVQPAEVLS